MSSERSSALNDNLLRLTGEIVAAFVANNPVDSHAIPLLIRQVYETLQTLGQPAAAAQGPQASNPAVPIKRSVTPDYIICLEDGKKLKMLKRHLKTAYDMSPDDYRERWGLPSDYPMVAPNYAKQRSRLAKDIGLGTKGKSKRRKTA